MLNSNCELSLKRFILLFRFLSCNNDCSALLRLFFLCLVGFSFIIVFTLLLFDLALNGPGLLGIWHKRRNLNGARKVCYLRFCLITSRLTVWYLDVVHKCSEACISGDETAVQRISTVKRLNLGLTFRKRPERSTIWIKLIERVGQDKLQDAIAIEFVELSHCKSYTVFEGLWTFLSYFDCLLDVFHFAEVLESYLFKRR